MRIDILDGDWSGGQPEDIRRVCFCVAQCFAFAVAERPLESIRVEPGTLGHPRALCVRGNEGQVRVLLSARGGYWGKFAYQFGHEFCHVLANVPSQINPATAATDWIEEALCETATLYALRTMAPIWTNAADEAIRRAYAPEFVKYADATMEEYQMPNGKAFPEWFVETLPLLTRGPYNSTRQEIGVVAVHLLPLFEDAPDSWRAVRYLNLWTIPPSSITEYFDAWRSVAPIQLHDSIERIRAVITGVNAALRSESTKEGSAS